MACASLQNEIQLKLMQHVCMCNETDKSSLQSSIGDVIQSVRNLSQNQGDGSHGDAVYESCEQSSIEGTRKEVGLCQLSFLISFFEHQSCYSVKQLQQDWEWTSLLVYLIDFFSTADLTKSFLLVKCTLEIFKRSQTIDLDKVFTVLQFDSILNRLSITHQPRNIKNEEDRPPETPSKSYHKLLSSLELLRKTLKIRKIIQKEKLHSKVCPCYQIQQTCDEGDLPNKIYFEQVEMHSEKIIWEYGKLFEILLEVHLNTQIGNKTRDGACVDDCLSSVKYFVNSFIHELGEMEIKCLLYAVLKLLKTAFKREDKQYDQIRRNLSLLFVKFLKHSTNISRKNILISIDILNIQLQNCFGRSSKKDGHMKGCDVCNNTGIDKLNIVSTNNKEVQLCIEQCFSLFSKQWLEWLPLNEGPHGFGGCTSRLGHGSDMEGCDFIMYRKIILLLSLSFLNLIGMVPFDHLQKVIEEYQRNIELISLKYTKEDGIQNHDINWILQIFSDQDDLLIKIVSLYFEIHAVLKERIPRTKYGDDFLSTINPHGMFWRLITFLSFDPSVMLDLLISSETEFVIYFIKYLHFVADDWGSFVKFLQNVPVDDGDEDYSSVGDHGDLNDSSFHNSGDDNDESCVYGGESDDNINNNSNDNTFNNDDSNDKKFDDEDTFDNGGDDNVNNDNDNNGDDNDNVNNDDDNDNVNNDEKSDNDSHPDDGDDNKALGVNCTFGKLNDHPAGIDQINDTDNFDDDNGDGNDNFDNTDDIDNFDDGHTDGSLNCIGIVHNGGDDIDVNFLGNDKNHDSHFDNDRYQYPKDIHNILNKENPNFRAHNNDGNTVEDIQTNDSIGKPKSTDDYEDISGQLDDTNSSSEDSLDEPPFKQFKASSLSTESNTIKLLSPDISQPKNEALDKLMTVFIRLRYSLERLQDKKLLPYDVNPLLTLLFKLEDFYENPVS